MLFDKVVNGSFQHKGVVDGDVADIRLASKI